MAWLEQEDSGIYYICFRYQGQRIKRYTRTRDESKAEAMMGRIDENIELVNRGRLQLPNDTDVFRFLLSDGQINSNKPVKIQSLELVELFQTYRDSLPVEVPTAPDRRTSVPGYSRRMTRLS